MLDNFLSNDLNHPLEEAILGCGKDGITNTLEVLVKNRMLINDGRPSGYRPIIQAIRIGNVKVVNLLLENGAILHWPSRVGDWPPPLGAAAWLTGKFPSDTVLEMIEALHKRGAEINPVDSPAPLHYAMCARGRNGLRISVLQKLIELGANVNHKSLVPNTFYPANSHSGTPLHAYFASGYDAVAILLENGADTSIENSDGLDAIGFFEKYKEFATEEAEEINDILGLLRERSPKRRPKSKKINREHNSNNYSKLKRIGFFVLVCAVIGALLTHLLLSGSAADKGKWPNSQLGGTLELVSGEPSETWGGQLIAGGDPRCFVWASLTGNSSVKFQAQVAKAADASLKQWSTGAMTEGDFRECVYYGQVKQFRVIATSKIDQTILVGWAFISKGKDIVPGYNSYYKLRQYLQREGVLVPG
ncbi:MAG: hypothetical protein IPH26_09820 [Sterolibacteriaceae bacterium]|uniref:Ankyrin repeat domain-containing protein n=1 Tax=Candidatus Methylophosphatis roskildensis TaxID=2899263 RepID=A0A9D7E3N9_9PROT|nr:hypothetical protein [Candidatus Methylophosphatis roskildensis]MBK7238202.1 hypothetical protein [Sterolibacteriaceae bacterium]